MTAHPKVELFTAFHRVLLPGERESAGYRA
jgi:hypothetical protein